MLRRVLNKARVSAPQMMRQLSLSISVKKMNSTARPNDLDPSLLVFGNLPELRRMQNNDQSSTTGITDLQLEK